MNQSFLEMLQKYGAGADDVDPDALAEEELEENEEEYEFDEMLIDPSRAQKKKKE